jgi:TPR repeat protein
MPKDDSGRPLLGCMIRPPHSHSLMSAVEAGDPSAQFELGRTYFEGRPESASSSGSFASFTPAIRRDLAAAEDLLKKAADQGHEEAAKLLEVVKLHTHKGVH